MLAVRAEIGRWAEVKAADVHDFNELAFWTGWRLILESEAAMSADVAVDGY
jgi:hypothetical protein